MHRNDYVLEKDRLNESRVFRDPIHRYIHIYHLPFWQLINTKEMQRLRRIHQLGGTHQVYQTAEHTRFPHSLGVYEVVRRMLELETFQGQLNDYERLSVLCSALLHDVGHGPFSHSFEHVFAVSHEDFTRRIILDPDTEVNQVLASYHPKLPEDVASIIEKTHPNPLLIQLVSSQIDGDRMDYLLRDSYFTGTSYGNFDMERILRTLRVKNKQIVFKESGVQAIEDYILARYHMYWQVYYHPTTRSYERLLILIFRRIRDLYQQGYPFENPMPYLMPFIAGEDVSVEAYLKMDESCLLYYFSLLEETKDAILSDLCTRFLSRKLFKYRNLKDEADYARIRDQLEKLGYDVNYYLAMDDPKQTPYIHYGAGHEVEEIQILRPDGSIRLLPEVSEIVHAIVESKLDKQDKKVYFPKEVKNWI
ncbi:MAG TPA: HD domain-containing protein [Candidatus Fimiplasma intestinipullorum]|uniref:HD domain-containing protein n=1 Tax=Candidatus Fimiplasma intestinipullorum TaxID=2840825 RepID=A0A9D1KZS1_9FIRM|nr:HD domain-containing protein [Candidatus Fimiplasma intestinipullorum]